MVTWTTDKDAKFLLLIIQKCAVKVPYDEIAKDLTTEFGEDVTPKALTHRYQKLKGKAEKPEKDSGGTTPPATPKAKAKAKTAPAGSASNKKRKLAEAEGDEVKSEVKVKAENSMDD